MDWREQIFQGGEKRWSSQEKRCIIFGGLVTQLLLQKKYGRSTRQKGHIYSDVLPPFHKSRNAWLGWSPSCRCLRDTTCQWRARLIRPAGLMRPDSMLWPMAYRPWALAELTWHRPFVGTGRLVVIRRKLQSDQVTSRCWQSVPTLVKRRRYTIMSLIKQKYIKGSNMRVLLF